jgi:hypothetical protein
MIFSAGPRKLVLVVLLGNDFNKLESRFSIAKCEF